MQYLLCIYLMKRENLILKNCSWGLTMLRISAQSDVNETLLHTHKHTSTQTHRPSCLQLWSVTEPPSFPLAHRGSQSTEDSTTKAFYCFIASSQRKGAQRTVEPPPWPPLSLPQPPSCWEEQACGGQEASPFLKASIWIDGSGHRYPPN